jgi:hypothetical protein
MGVMLADQGDPDVLSSEITSTQISGACTTPELRLFAPASLAVFRPHRFQLSSEKGAVEACLRHFALNGRIKFPGATGRVQVEGWPELVKVNLEASFLVQGGVFISWETTVTVPAPERPPSDLLEKSSHALRSAAAAFGLEFGAFAP